MSIFAAHESTITLKDIDISELSDFCYTVYNDTIVMTIHCSNTVSKLKNQFRTILEIIKKNSHYKIVLLGDFNCQIKKTDTGIALYDKDSETELLEHFDINDMIFDCSKSNFKTSKKIRFLTHQMQKFFKPVVTSIDYILVFAPSKIEKEMQVNILDTRVFYGSQEIFEETIPKIEYPSDHPAIECLIELDSILSKFIVLNILGESDSCLESSSIPTFEFIPQEQYNQIESNEALKQMITDKINTFKSENAELIKTKYWGSKFRNKDEYTLKPYGVFGSEEQKEYEQKTDALYKSPPEYKIFWDFFDKIFNSGDAVLQPFIDEWRQSNLGSKKDNILDIIKYFLVHHEPITLGLVEVSKNQADKLFQMKQELFELGYEINIGEFVDKSSTCGCIIYKIDCEMSNPLERKELKQAGCKTTILEQLEEGIFHNEENAKP